MNILDEQIETGTNARALFSRHRSFVWLLVFSATLDAASTVAFMSVWGPAREQTWIIRELSFAFGILLGPAVGKFFQFLAVVGLAVIAPRLTRLVCTTVILLNLFAFVVNMHVFFAGR